MSSAIIGSTGFVGGNLIRQTPFDDEYHSTNIDAIAGKTYDLVVCAGAPAAKWLANRDPESDLANLQHLIACLRMVTAGTFVLVSTVDVYPSPVDVTEDVAIDDHGLHAYGRHRLQLERFVRHAFDDALTVRLPGLFGRGLKKNVVYDLLHDHQVDQIHPDGSFQFYHLDNLWADITRARQEGFTLVNFATAPTTVREVAREAFGVELERRSEARPASYDVRSRHALAMGGSDGYLYNRDQVLGALKTFVDTERGAPR